MRLPARTLVLVALASLASASACSKSSRRNWWCVDDGACFATAASCDQRASAFGGTGRCENQPIAYCKLVCSPAACHEACERSEAACDDVDTDEPTRCEPRRPPRHTQLFPNYSAPGWWCRRAKGPSGQTSQCVKGKPVCDAYRRNTEASVGVPQTPCEYHTDPVCFSLTMNGDHEYQCSLTTDDCVAVRKAMQAGAAKSPIAITALSACAPWRYASDTDRRAVPRPKKKRPPGLTLVFDVDRDNRDPVRTVRLLRDRVARIGFDSADVELGGDQIELFLPGEQHDTKLRDGLPARLAQTIAWSLYRVANDASLSKGLAAYTKAFPDAAALDVLAMNDPSGRPYLHANGVESGRKILEAYVASYLATNPSSASGHVLVYEQTDVGWRTHELESAPLLGSSDLHWASLGWDRRRPIVTLRWNDDTVAKAQRVMATGTPLAVVSEGSHAVGCLVQAGQLPSGQFALVPIARGESTQRAALDLRDQLRAGLAFGATLADAARASKQPR